MTSLSLALRDVRSGGQDGVDIAGLRSAKRLGITTSGLMPKGWLTHSGPKPEYASLYGLREHRLADYGPRTDQNVRDADMTLRIYENPHSPGERRTLRAIGRGDYYDIGLGRSSSKLFVLDDQALARAALAVQWVAKKYNRPISLNVAGNSERTSRGIELIAEELLLDLFTRLLK